jgi:hypothetical protein
MLCVWFRSEFLLPAADDASEWKKEIKAEFDQFEKYIVFKPIFRKNLPENEKILTTTWALSTKQMVLGEVI